MCLILSKKQLILPEKEIKITKNFTKEDLAEFVVNKYSNNCTQFVTDFTKLFVDIDGTINKPYKKQWEFMNTLSKQDRVTVVIKSRQSGFSTSIVARAFWDCFFGKVPDTVIVSATKTQAIKVMRRIKQCFLDLPEAMRPDFKVDQAQELILNNGCRIVSLSSNPSSMRGWTGVFMLDEYAMHTEKDSEAIYEACYPATTKGGRIIAVSSPFGTKGMYYKLATKDFTEISGNKTARNQRKFFVHWKDVPFIKEAVLNKGLFDGLPLEMIDQEYELNFREDSNEDSFFSKEFIFEHYNDKENEEVEKIYHNYQDLGIDWSYIHDLDKPIEEKLIKTELKDRYLFIQAGWDIASTSNDSIMVVRGIRRDKDISEIIGEFYVNRIPYQSDLKKFDTRFESTTLQWYYIKRILEVLLVDNINIDGTGMGKVVYQNIRATESDYFVRKVTSTIYTNNNVNNWKYESFLMLKRLMVENKLKRIWSGNQKDNEMLIQMTNLKKLTNNSLSSTGRKKDDYPNALMLSIFSRSEKSKPKIFLI